MSSTLRAAPTWQTKPPSPNPCGGEILLNLTKENPYKDAVRFDWKNQKYTFEALNFNSMAIATGFLETGLQPGDVCLSWLPLHFAEHVRINKRNIQGICDGDWREKLFGYKCCRVVAIRWCMMLFCGLFVYERGNFVSKSRTQRRDIISNLRAGLFLYRMRRFATEISSTHEYPLLFLLHCLFLVTSSRSFFIPSHSLATFDCVFRSCCNSPVPRRV
jgi:hypothetical protein